MVDIIFGKLSITILHILYILTGQYFFVRGGLKKSVEFSTLFQFHTKKIGSQIA